MGEGCSTMAPARCCMWLLAASALLAGMSLAPAKAVAHDLPGRITVQAFVKPEDGALVALLRIPMEAFGEAALPLRGPGHLRIGAADAVLRDAAWGHVVESLRFFADGVELEEKRLEAVRVSLPSSRAFADFASALEHVKSPPLGDEVDLFWRQALLDVLIRYPIESADSAFSLDAQLGTLSGETTTTLRFVLPDGGERLFGYIGNPGLVELDPRWHQASLRFVVMGFWHILEGIDHLLFLFCLVIPLRSLRHLLPVVTSFTIAHSITLIASAMGIAPRALWFPPLIETLIALSIVYMALENIVGSRAGRRWTVAFGFGLVHGFGFSFVFSETLQFAGGHLLAALLAFNVGVELGQLLVLVLVIPLLNVLFRHLLAERIGCILLSALLAHSAWHWMLERGAQLQQFRLQYPVFDHLFYVALMRWTMLLLVIAGCFWLTYELFRRFQLVPRFGELARRAGDEPGEAAGR